MYKFYNLLSFIATLDYSINILFFYFASEIFKAIVVVDYVYWK